MNPSRLLTAILLALLYVASASAQTGNLGRQDNREILRMGLYPPDIIMRHQKRLEITPDQRRDIAALVRDFQAGITELQWSMPAEQQELRTLLNEPSIEKEAALDRVKNVLAMETEFKLAHFELLIAIKNRLTATQVQMLNSEIRRRMRKEGGQ